MTYHIIPMSDMTVDRSQLLTIRRTECDIKLKTTVTESTVQTVVTEYILQNIGKKDNKINSKKLLLQIPKHKCIAKNLQNSKKNYYYEGRQIMLQYTTETYNAFVALSVLL